MFNPVKSYGPNKILWKTAHFGIFFSCKFGQTRPGSKVISLINFEPFMGLKIGLTLHKIVGLKSLRTARNF